MPSILELGRFQFAMTTIFHFLFVPLSIGLAFVVAVMETLYVKTGKEEYKSMTRFWAKIFLLSFSVGVVTGIIQEFQFGMNWSAYSRFVGDIFGAPLAVEALLAFFMESTFLGVWFFSWDKVSKKVHCLFIWLVSIGSALSALWILIANSFMQYPQGFEIIDGRAQLTDFAAVVFNHHVAYQYGHVIFSALLLASAFIIGSSAFLLLKKKEVQLTSFYKKSIAVALSIFLVGNLGALLFGDLQMQAMVEDQPMKFAAVEGLYETTGESAPWTVVAWIDEKDRKKEYALEIPALLSLLAYHDTTGAVKGMNEIEKELTEKYGSGDYTVPVNALFWSFRLMAGFAGLFLLFALLALIFRKKLEQKRWLLVLLSSLVCLPFVATTAGWLITELGRYPWTVYGLFTIADSISPNVSAGSLLFTNITYFLLFTLLAAVMITLMVKEFKKGPFAVEHAPSVQEVDPLAKEV